jgi:predicted O-methyltransferase YrrM
MPKPLIQDLDISIYDLCERSSINKPIEYKPHHKFFLDFQKKIYDEYGYVLDKLNPTDYFWFIDRETLKKNYYKVNAHSYYTLYSDYLHERRKKVKKVLEIGVFTGYSMLMWREYFPNAEIVGIDIDLGQKWMGKDARDLCKGKDRITLIEDDGTNKNIAKQIGEKYGMFDVIIDDGSHHPTHQILSLIHYLPFLNPDGIFIIEDIITETQRDYLGVFNHIAVDGEVKLVKLFEEFYEDYKVDTFWVEDVDLKPYGVNIPINQEILLSIDKFEIKEPPPHQIGELYNQILKSKHKMAFITKKNYLK